MLMTVTVGSKEELGLVEKQYFHCSERISEITWHLLWKCPWQCPFNQL